MRCTHHRCANSAVSLGSGCGRRSHSHEQGVRDWHCAIQSLGAWLLDGSIKLEHVSDNDFRKNEVLFFQSENLEKNQQLLKCVAKIAVEKKCITSQLALAWVIHKGAGRAVPFRGTTKIANLESNMASSGVKLTEEDMKALEDAAPASEVAGERFGAQMISFGWQDARTPLSSWRGTQVELMFFPINR